MATSEYHKRYYIETNVDDLLLKARNRVEELTIMKAIASIDRKLKLLKEVTTLYSPQNVTHEEPSAVYIAPFPDQEKTI